MWFGSLGKCCYVATKVEYNLCAYTLRSVNFVIELQMSEHSCMGSCPCSNVSKLIITHIQQYICLLVSEKKKQVWLSCLKNQPDAFSVQYTQLSLGQAIKLSGTAKILTQHFRHAPPVSSCMPRNHDLYSYLPRFRHLGNTKLLSFAVAWPANLQKLLYTVYITHVIIVDAQTDKQTRKT